MVRGFFLEGGSLGSVLSQSQHAVGSSTAALGRRHRVPQGWVRSVTAALTGAHLPGHAPWGRHAQHPSAAGSCLQPPACRLPASPCCIRPHSLERQSRVSIPQPGTLPAPLCCLLFFRHFHFFPTARVSGIYDFSCSLLWHPTWFRNMQMQGRQVNTTEQN